MNDRIRILIVEDLPTDAELGMREVSRVLPQSEFRVVETREAFLEALESFRPDLILSDFKMPRFDGLTALQLAKEVAPDTPFIIVTGSMNEDTAVDCMKAGAWDYIIKEHIKRLGPAVLNGLEQKTFRMERTQAAAALKASEERFRNVAESMSSWIWEVDSDGSYTYCSGNYRATLGYSEDEILGKTPFDFMPADEAGRVGALFGEISRDRRPFYDLENWNLSRDGQRVCLLTSGVPIFGNAGEFMGYRGVDSDITERKRAEEERERLMAAINQAAETVVITNTEGTIEYANPAFERITGYSCAEAVGKNPRFLKSGEHDDTFYHKLWDTLLRGEIWGGRFINKKKDGTLYTEEATISPVKDGSGTIVNYVAVKRDVTEDLKLEEQLRQSQKMQSIGQLVGGVAHDFNNLLQIINGYVQIALTQLDPTHVAVASLEEVAEAGARAKEIVQQLLAFSRQQAIDPVKFELNQEIESSRKILGRLIGEHIRLEFVAGKELGHVFSDKGQIQQVLMNLCVNARDAMPDGGTLTFKTENVVIAPEDLKAHVLTRPGRYVLLSVEDTGRGMDKKTCEKIFDPFFTTKEVGKGTGLGLSTVYGIVKQNNGNIHVYSELGKGTVFKIYLPVIHPLPESIIDSIAEKDGPEEVGVETILVVEDEKTLLKLAAQILTGAGYTVLTAKDGVEAVQVFEEHADAIDMVMMDVVMPRMGGKDAMMRILKKRPSMRYLFVSGYSHEAEHNTFIQDKLLDKPYTVVGLLHKIREVLEA